MRRRVEETLDLLGLHELRARPLEQLSGGQRQRVAIGSVLTAHPSVLVLDEPTSALDPPAAEEVLAALQRLVHDLGVTVLLAEHRLERVVQFADRVIHVPGDGRALEAGSSRRVLATSAGGPAGGGARPGGRLARRCRCRCVTPAVGPELRERLAGHRCRPNGHHLGAGAPVAALRG
jgi:energy-coupling factor transport system ATP-binding protein